MIRQANHMGIVVDDLEQATTFYRGTRGVELLDTPNDKPFGRTFTLRTPERHVLRAYAPRS